MTTVSLDGIYSNSHQKACHKRYTAATAGIRIISGESSPKAAVKLCAMSEVDTIAWDLVDVEVSDGIRLCTESLFETIVSNNSLTLGSGGESATEDSGQTVISGYFISQCAFSMAFGNRPGNLVAGVEPPIDAWDVLDLERYSGRRKLNRRLIFEMEWAFACDGMSWNWQMFDFDSWVVPVGLPKNCRPTAVDCSFIATDSWRLADQDKHIARADIHKKSCKVPIAAPSRTWRSGAPGMRTETEMGRAKSLLPFQLGQSS